MPKRVVCIHGHPRTPENLTRWGACRTCGRACGRKRYAAKPEKYRLRAQASARKRQYKITPERFAALVERQSGKCVCGKTFGTEKGMLPCIDHDHVCCPSKKRSCGRCVRGLLCNRCNTVLGLLEKEPHLLPQFLAAYKGAAHA